MRSCFHPPKPRLVRGRIECITTPVRLRSTKGTIQPVSDPPARIYHYEGDGFYAVEVGQSRCIMIIHEDDMEPS